MTDNIILIKFGLFFLNISKIIITNIIIKATIPQSDASLWKKYFSVIPVSPPGVLYNRPSSWKSGNQMI